jgi:hypothetical protein
VKIQAITYAIQNGFCVCLAVINHQEIKTEACNFDSSLRANFSKNKQYYVKTEFLNSAVHYLWAGIA